MKSMTGFGRANLETNYRMYSIEIKSVNHKYHDISIKLPRSLAYLEDNIKKEVGKYIARGKIDVFIHFQNASQEGKQVIMNHEIITEYLKELQMIAKENQLSLEIPVIELTKLPEVLTIRETEEAEDKIQQELLECLRQAMEQFIGMRQEEGNQIKEDLYRRIQKVKQNVEKISKYSTRLVEEYVVKLEERSKELLKTDIVDQTRLAMEVVIYADKCSIEEEITRLRSHMEQFVSLLEEDKPVGKKMDFLIQEMNRETNTIGSKAGGIEITNLVINLKIELEDIREQIQNIE